MEPHPAAVLRKSRTAEKTSADEDLEMRILLERLRLLDNQRRMQAASCQRFTDMMEAALLRQSSQIQSHTQTQAFTHSHSHGHSSQQKGEQQLLTRRRHSSASRDAAPAAAMPSPCLAPCATMPHWPKGAHPTGLEPFETCESSDDDGERYWTQPCGSSPRMLPQQTQGGCLRGSASDCSSLSQDAWEVQQYYQTSQPSARRKGNSHRCIRRQQRASFGL